jgi:hypothetical protein
MLGNLDTNTIEEILNGPGLREIQDTLRQGIMHEKYCKNCVDRESTGGDSERSWHNQVNEDFDPAALEQLDQYIKKLESEHHPDQAGQFAVSWPELESLLWH